MFDCAAIFRQFVTKVWHFPFTSTSWTKNILIVFKTEKQTEKVLSVAFGCSNSREWSSSGHVFTGSVCRPSQSRSLPIRGWRWSRCAGSDASIMADTGKPRNEETTKSKGFLWRGLAGKIPNFTSGEFDVAAVNMCTSTSCERSVNDFMRFIGLLLGFWDVLSFVFRDAGGHFRLVIEMLLCSEEFVTFPGGLNILLPVLPLSALSLSLSLSEDSQWVYCL